MSLPTYVANKAEAQRNEITRAHNFFKIGRNKIFNPGQSNSGAPAPSVGPHFFPKKGEC